MSTAIALNLPMGGVTDILEDLNLDNDAKDQVGTLLVALLVGGLATIARIAVIRKNRWWFNMILFHGAIFVYWWNMCHSAEPTNPWLATVHGGICWRDTEGNFQQISFWGGDRERFWLNVLVWLAILGNVVPAYAKGNEAGRHMTHVKKRACNPLINHIIAGILCVTFPYFVFLFKGESIMILIAVAFDLYHQITIHRLIANHDGIWVLRACSMSLAITKWIVILNMLTTDPWNMLDQIFVLSTGFLGTRAYGALAFLAYYAGLGDIKSAEWYSIGLMTADIMIMGRMWGQMRVAFWLTIVNCAAMHYHQMWKKWIHLRPQFVGCTAILTVIVCHSGVVASLLFTAAWSFGNFVLPHFNRLRPAPKALYTPSVTPAYKMIKDFSGALSARLKKLSTRGSRKSASFRRTSSMRAQAMPFSPALSTFQDRRLSTTFSTDPRLSIRSNCSTISENVVLKQPMLDFGMGNTSTQSMQSTLSRDETEYDIPKVHFTGSICDSGPRNFHRVDTPFLPKKGSARDVPEAPIWLPTPVKRDSTKLQRIEESLKTHEQRKLADEMEELRAKFKALEDAMTRLTPKNSKQRSDKASGLNDISREVSCLSVKSRMSRELSAQEEEGELPESPRVALPAAPATPDWRAYAKSPACS